MPTEPLRILIVANKTWECDPLVSVLLSKDGPPGNALGNFVRGFDPAGTSPMVDPSTGAAPTLPPQAQGLPLRSGLPPLPRLSLDVGPKGAPLAKVEVWCVEDWMRRLRHVLTGTAPVSGSSSHEKFHVALPIIRAHAFKGHGCGLVIAFGTAGIPADQTFNGCVTIGSRAYLNDPWDDASTDEIAAQEIAFGPLLQGPLDGWLGKRLDCPRLSDALFANGISVESRYAAEGRFIEAPINPARPPRILAGHGYASLGTINICDYDDYVWADEETHRRFERQVKQREIGSAETTHGLIRLVWHDSPFLFVSALTDRVPNFNAEVTPRKYSQNFAAAHNAGVALAHLLPELGRLAALRKDGLFNEGKETIAYAEGPLPTPSWPSAAPHQGCPDHEAGETALDCPWAGIAREAVATRKRGSALNLRDRAPGLFDAIARDGASAGCLESWGECLNFDELALAPIVHPAILDEIAVAAGLSKGGPTWHAGLTHTYGYLFSLLRTAFGYKRRRWVSPDLALALGLPKDLLGPISEEGTLLTKVTWLFGRLAFANEPALARLGQFEDQVPAALRSLPYESFLLKRKRLVETVTLAGPGATRVECRTDLIELPRPGADSHLLVYSIDSGQPDGAQLISGFPVGAEMVRTLIGEGTPSTEREVRTRYNAYVPGLTQLGAWQLKG